MVFKVSPSGNVFFSGDFLVRLKYWLTCFDGSKEKLEIAVRYDCCFVSQTLFEIFEICRKHARLERIPPSFPYSKHLQAIDLLFVTFIEMNL